ncbi:MAG: hypothetical protein J6U54_05335 [Clostridiales bacterium]|nr:hypothetical protein [Clostridiales bacterium]
MRNKKALSDALDKLNCQLRNEMHIPLSDFYKELNLETISPNPYTYSGWDFTLRGASVVPNIKKVIFNYPATIVLWEDGTKTVVKVKEDEEFDEWAGLAFCICKKLYGDQFHKIFRKYCDPAVEQKKEALALFDVVKKITGFSF